MYGLDKECREFWINQIKKEKQFLESNYFDLGSDKIKMSELVKNAYHNADRYIAEVNHRVYSLNQYAQSKNLKNIFGTITLPSEYHELVDNKYRNKKYANKHIDTIYDIKTKEPSFENVKFEDYTPNAGAKKLSKMFKSILDLRAYRDIEKEDKCYFRVYEPHKDGTPHLHFSMFVPENKADNVVSKFKEYFNRNYKGLRVDFQTDIENPVAYLMKYILKTFDDFRAKDSKITDLSLWYKANRITRFYTSRTLISLDVYRALNGRYELLELTQMYRNSELTVLLDPDTKKVMGIYDGYFNVYNKKQTEMKKVDNRINLKYKKKKQKEPKLIIDGVQYTVLDGNLKKFEPIVPVKYRDTETIVNDISELIQNENYDTNAYGLLNNELLYREFKYFDMETREIKCDEIIPLNEYGV